MLLLRGSKPAVGGKRDERGPKGLGHRKVARLETKFLRIKRFEMNGVIMNGGLNAKISKPASGLTTKRWVQLDHEHVASMERARHTRKEPNMRVPPGSPFVPLKNGETLLVSLTHAPKLSNEKCCLKVGQVMHMTKVHHTTMLVCTDQTISF